MATPDSGRQPRLAPGELTASVLRYLRTHPGLDFSPHKVATVGGRSQGTIRRILLQLTDTGTVTRTQHRPARFRITT
jgi:DNA-binding IclR family transcriptional regulator